MKYTTVIYFYIH